MPNQAAFLYQLQLVDQDIARNRARLKAIEALLNNDETIAQANQQLDSTQTALKPWQTRARDLDLEIKTIADKVKTNDADLYSGRIRNPKALQELQEEAESLKRHQSQLEDQLLEAMLLVEEHQGQVNDAQGALKNARAALASKQTDLLDEQKRLEAEVIQADTKRKSMSESIEPASLATYEKLRPRFRGQVVALLEEDGCSLCGVGQTVGTERAVHQGRVLTLCESCGRILADIS